MKLKIGDRVRVKEIFNWGRILLKKGLTGKVIGKHGTIICIEFDEYIDGHDGAVFNSIGKNGYCWNFENEELEYFEIIKEKEMKKEDIILKRGDVVTYQYLDGNKSIFYISANGVTINSFSGKILKIERPIKYETIYEAPKEILGKEEKEYLENFIRPFGDRVKCIQKSECDKREYLTIDYDDDDWFILPDFKKNTMYKGMKANKKYTLEELGLFEGE